MKKKIRWAVGLLFVLAFSIMQLYPPEKNDEKVTRDSIIFQVEIPSLVRKTLVSACFDCHSSQTRYPWYAEVAPISWMIDSHIRKGKANLNFSAWASYTSEEQIDLLEEISKVVRQEEMPLTGYVLFHRDARLFKHEIEELSAWAGSLADSLKQKKLP